MTRGRISSIRALMLMLVFFGFYFLSTKYSELTLIGFIVSMIIGIVFWLGAENEWKNSENNPAPKNTIGKNVTSYKESNNPSIGQTIIIIAAICTIIGTIILLMKECS